MIGGPIRTLYVRELRSALRERNLVVYTLLLPLLLYPVILWLTFSAMSFVAGQTEEQSSRVVAIGFADEHASLRDALQGAEKLEVREPGGPVEQAIAAVQSEEADLVLQLVPARGEAAQLAGNFAVELHYSGADDRSAEALNRVEEVLEEDRAARLEREVGALGVAPETFRVFEIERDNVASSEDMGAFLLGELLPITMLVMIALGSMYPAIDTIAGERERSTWETSLTLGSSRAALVVSKYLYVATLGATAGLLNVAGIAASMGPLFSRLAGDEASISVTLPIAAVPVIVLGTALLAMLFAALMMIAAAFARTYKEGQSLVTPVYFLLFLPVLAAGLPDESIGLGLAAVPGANVMLLFKQVISGDYRPAFIAVTLVTSGAAVAAALWLAARLIRNEELIMGSFKGSPRAFLRSLMRGKR